MLLHYHHHFVSVAATAASRMQPVGCHHPNTPPPTRVTTRRRLTAIGTMATLEEVATSAAEAKGTVAVDKVLAATASAVDQAKSVHPTTADVVAGPAGTCPVAAAPG